MIARKLSASRKKGFTLTEIAIVLGVIGIILGGVWMAAGQVNEKARVTQSMNAFGAITQNMTSLMQGGYGVTNTIVAASDITTSMLPSSVSAGGTGVIPMWLLNGTSVTNPWTSTNGIKMWWVSNSPHTYRLSFYGVTQQGCVGLLSQLTNCTPGQAGCPVNVVVGGTEGTFSAVPPGTAQSTTTGLNTTTIQSLCTAGANHNTYPGGGAVANSVEFDFTQ